MYINNGNTKLSTCVVWASHKEVKTIGSNDVKLYGPVVILIMDRKCKKITWAMIEATVPSTDLFGE